MSASHSTASSPVSAATLAIGAGLSGQDLIFGPFRVTPQGSIAPRLDNLAATFDFTWRDRWVQAKLHNSTLSLLVGLGRVPSTARDGAAAREQVFGMLRSLPDALPAHWRITVQPDHRVALRRTEQIDLPVTPSELLTGLILFLLTLAPYLDLLDEAGLVLAACPG